MKAVSPFISPASALASKPNELLAPFDFTPLNRVVFGPGSLARLGELVRELGGRRVLLVTDPGLETAGHPQRAHQNHPQSRHGSFPFRRGARKPDQQAGGSRRAFARGWAIDFIVAVGGGSSMDCAKGINFLLTNGGKMADYKGFGNATKPMLPSIGVPTTAGTGSEAQCYALITDERTHLKMACGDKKAAFRVAILDPELTVSQPRHVAAVTGIDALSHADRIVRQHAADARLATLFAQRLSLSRTEFRKGPARNRTTWTPAARCRSAPILPASPSRTRCSASAMPAPTR